MEVLSPELWTFEILPFLPSTQLRSLCSFPELFDPVCEAWRRRLPVRVMKYCLLNKIDPLQLLLDGNVIALSYSRPSDVVWDEEPLFGWELYHADSLLPLIENLLFENKGCELVLHICGVFSSPISSSNLSDFVTIRDRLDLQLTYGGVYVDFIWIIRNKNTSNQILYM